MIRLETKLILNDDFDEKEKNLFREFASIIENNYKDIQSHMKIWEYDQSLGGLGGYATPLNPVINPFNTWNDYRNVFRSLQYARSDMFICARPRHIIISSALHVESLVKILLFQNRIFKSKFNRREFGKNINDLFIKNIIDEKIRFRLSYLRQMLNDAKHDTDPDNNITFDYEDAVVFYFETRKVGNDLLKLLNHETYGKIYEIATY